MNNVFIKAKNASRMLAMMGDDERNNILYKVANRIEEQSQALLKANLGDLDRMEKDCPLYDRLQLTEKRLADIASDMRNVARLSSPLGAISEKRVLQNGMRLHRVSVPFGVVGVVYEARPNVTFDVFSLCFKSGNACILKGGKDAEHSNEAAVDVIHAVLREEGVDENFVALLPATHEATAELLNAVGFVDLCIPRGGRKLIDFVRDNARVPVIETGAGVVNTYFDESADVNMGASIIFNAKTRRVSVCNALDCLLVHRSRLLDLPELCKPLGEKNVRIYADGPAYEALKGKYKEELLMHSSPSDYGSEFMDYKISVKTVNGLQDAIAHISEYGSGHSECIITSDAEAAKIFQQQVDAACVYWNVPTSFTDGAQFGLGAEIGISTQKLGPRGPMGLRELTTYKWIIEGEGQIRK